VPFLPFFGSIYLFAKISLFLPHFFGKKSFNFQRKKRVGERGCLKIEVKVEVKREKRKGRDSIGK
jgi:hypothetical protein